MTALRSAIGAATPVAGLPRYRVVVISAAVVLLALGAGVVVGLGFPMVAAAVAGLVILVALLGDLERVGGAMVVAGYGAVAVLSDTVTTEAGVQGSSVRASSVEGLAYGLLLGGVLLLAFVPVQRAPVPLERPHLLLAGYLVCAALGAMNNPDPGLFVIRWAQVTLPFAALVLYWRRKGSSMALVRALLVAASIHVASAALALATGRSSLEGGGSALVPGGRLGGLLHPAFLAFVAGCVAAWCLWRVMTAPAPQATRAVPGLLVAAAVVGYSRGRTGFLAAAAMTVVVVIHSTRRRRQPGDAAVDPRSFLILGVALLTVVFSSTLVDWFVRDKVEELGTLTNRTRLWSVAVELVGERPVVGWGPGLLRSGPVAERVERRVGFVGHAHNSLLDATLAAGLVGGGLWLAAFTSTGLRLFRRRADGTDLASFLPCVWAGCLVYAISEGNMSGFGFPWLLMLALAGAVPGREPVPASG